MDNTFPPNASTPLILPRRLSTGQTRGQKPGLRHMGSFSSTPATDASVGKPLRTQDDLSLGGTEFTHYYYYPTRAIPSSSSPPSSATVNNGPRARVPDQSPMPPHSGSPPPIFSFGSNHAQDGFVAPLVYSPPPGGEATFTGTSGRHRRHSLASGSPWTTVPPRHALHMPVMKINPEVWRSENHQREIHRLMREGREEAVMKRRNMKSMMETSEEGDEDDMEMSDVVLTVDMGGFRAQEEHEKELEREQVRQQWQQTLNQAQSEINRRRSWPYSSGQQFSSQYHPAGIGGVPIVDGARPSNTPRVSGPQQLPPQQQPPQQGLQQEQMQQILLQQQRLQQQRLQQQRLQQQLQFQQQQQQQQQQQLQLNSPQINLIAAGGSIPTTTGASFGSPSVMDPRTRQESFTAYRG